MRNYFLKCSEVHLKINFVISEMKVYRVKFFLLNIHEATSLLDLDRPQRHKLITHLHNLIFFYKNYWPCLVGKCEKLR